MRPIDLIVVHCSDSWFGDVNLIRRWHSDPPPKGRGWADVGYHFVITNGYPRSGDVYDACMDGLVQPGRPLEQAGAHVLNHNSRSIGICLIGGRTPHGPVFDNWLSPAQRKSLANLLAELRTRFPGARIAGHRDFQPAKTCPNLDVAEFIKEAGLA